MQDSVKNNIVVEKLGGVPIEQQVVEVVERKGTGHPDYMADSIAEAFSRNLSRYYIDTFGSVLHHNVDKLEVIGGRTSPEFGGGRVIMPISILFSGRATDSSEGVKIPVREIAIESAKEWITDNLRFVNPQEIRYLFETKSGSASLSGIYSRRGTFSNDSSYGAGYAPLSFTEEAVLQIERLLNNPEFKRRHPHTGEDVKVMATRKESTLYITVADAFVDRYIDSVADYFDRKAEMYDLLDTELMRFLPADFSFKLGINCMDDRQREKDGIYLTVTGTSAEQGDDGSVGRGNRVNGLITPNRIMSFEATAGKNPVNHIGKLYNILAFQIAGDVYRETGKEVSVQIAGRIGDPVDEPLLTMVSTWPKPDRAEVLEINRMVENRISLIPVLTRDLIDGKLSIM